MKMVKKMGCSKWMLSLLVLAMIVSPVIGVSCGDAVSALIPCGSFLLGSGALKPSDRCCTGAQELNRMAATRAARKALCECLKSAVPSYGVKVERAKQLPSLCKIKLNIPISMNVNCNNI